MANGKLVRRDCCTGSESAVQLGPGVLQPRLDLVIDYRLSGDLGGKASFTDTSESAKKEGVGPATLFVCTRDYIDTFYGVVETRLASRGLPQGFLDSNFQKKILQYVLD